MLNQESIRKPLPLEKRSDLTVSRHSPRGVLEFVVHDPLTLENHRFNEHEFALLESLETRRSAVEIKQNFDTRFAPFEIEYAEIEKYLILFHEKNLLSTDSAGIGSKLFERSKKKRSEKLRKKLLSLLAMKHRGINPEHFLIRATQHLKWFFQPSAIALSLLVMIVAILIASVHHEHLRKSLPSFEQFFSAQNIVVVGTMVFVTKILHELGHGIVHTMLGGRCSELGVMFFYFMPTLYVNTSDSWKFRSKWQRASVAIAGIYIELNLAAFATLVWWFTSPSLLHYYAFNLMLTCSISAVVFNLNPLIKSDGYFLLSDLLELPNLQQRSSTFLRDVAVNFIGGSPLTSESQSAPRTKRFLIAYALLSFVYRVALIVGMTCLFTAMTRPIGLATFAKIAGGSLVVATITRPLIALAKAIRHQQDHINRKRVRRWLFGLIATAIVVVLPMPETINTSFVIEPRQCSQVFINQSNPIEEVFVTAGQQVDAGSPILRYRDTSLEMRAKEIQGEIQSLQTCQQDD